MSLFSQLSEAAARHGVHFLVIGGHAVIEHGFQRGTEDADILVCKDDRDRWREIVLQLGYKVFHDGGTFVQFEPTDPAGWNLDLMLVPAETFARLLTAAKPANMEGAAVVVPSLEHLLTKEFPDWSGHRAHRSRMSNDEWLAYCRSNLPKIRARPGFEEGRRQHGIDVEFSL